MSKNRNRALLNKAEDGLTYRKMWIKNEYPPYYDDGWYYWKSRGTRKWKKKQIHPYQVRMYKTWKYNRLTQWK
jgi:hypothetical protein